MRITNWLMSMGIAVLPMRAAPGLANERIWLKDAEINGKPARLCFDSGSNINALCQETVKKFGLKFIAAPTNDFSPGVLAGDTELCNMRFNGIEGQATFMVLNPPRYVHADFEGLIGWSSVSQLVLRIDTVAQEVTFLSKVPRQSAHWTRLSVVTNYGVLNLQTPRRGRAPGLLYIDTGDDGGVALPKADWSRWKEGHPNSSTTAKISWRVDQSSCIEIEAWADRILIGPLDLAGVPIRCASPEEETRWGTNYEASLGLAALKVLDLIVDGSNKTAYLRAKNTRPPAYSHNRLGAVFTPMGTHTNEAVAWVVKGSPADESGVRNGDILLQVDDVPCTSWSEDWLSRFTMPAGTKLKLTLERDGKTLKTTATLREILHPTTTKDK